MTDKQTPAPGGDDVVDELSEAISKGLAAWCESTPDIDLSPGLRRQAAEFIIGQPGLSAAVAAIPDTPSVERGTLKDEVATSVDDELTRAFIDGWNARNHYADFDKALHFWMLSGVTHIGETPLAAAVPSNLGEGA